MRPTTETNNVSRFKSSDDTTVIDIDKEMKKSSKKPSVRSRIADPRLMAKKAKAQGLEKRDDKPLVSMVSTDLLRMLSGELQMPLLSIAGLEILLTTDEQKEQFKKIQFDFDAYITLVKRIYETSKVVK